MKLINPTFFRRVVQEQPIDFLRGISIPRKPVSRRNFLKLVGLSAVVYDPVVNTIGKMVSPGFEMQKSAGQVRFLVDGKPCWEIATHCFDGPAKLQVKSEDQTIKIKLQKAWFPATKLKADLDCTIQKTEWGWRMNFEAPFFGSAKDVAFVKWLKGKQQMQSERRFKKTVCQLAPNESLSLSGKAKTQFDADWTAKMQANHLVTLDIQGTQHANQISFQLNSFRPQSNIQIEDLETETLIRIQHPEGLNPIQQLSLEQQQGIRMPENGFPELLIEAGKNQQEEPVYTLVQQGDQPWAYSPDQSLEDLQSNPFELSLESPYLVRSRKAEQTEFAFFAKLSEKPTVLKQGGQYITLNNTQAEKSSFEISGSSDQIHRVHCTPTVREVFVPIGKGLTMPMSYGEGQRLYFNDQVDPELVKQESLIHINKSNDQWHFSNNNQVFLPLIRKEDLAILGFHFVNFTINAETNQLVPVPNRTSFVSVIFPPQSIAERSYFYVKPGDQANEFPTALEIPYLLGGVSRLVFKMPTDQAPIDITVEDLLKWDDWSLNIHPRAKAPKPQFGFVYEAFDPGSFQIAPNNQLITTTDQTSRFRIQNTPNARIQSKPNTSTKPNRGRIKQPNNNRIKNPTRPPLSTEIKPIEGFLLRKNKDRKVQQALEAAVVQVPSGILEIVPAFVDSYITPRSLDTYIEVPFRVMISPSEKHTWLTDSSALNYNDPQTLVQKNASVGLNCGQYYDPQYYQVLPNLQVYELFHSSLARKSNKAPASSDNVLQMRAVWSKDAGEKYDEVTGDVYKWRQSLKPRHRHNIVHLSSNYGITGQTYNPATKGKTYNPKPFDVERLFLTPLGATIDFEGIWPKEMTNKPSDLNLIKWIHKGSFGRDHYVKVVESGYIFPFRNAAALVTLTERKLEQNVAGKGSTALNRQIQFIIIREAVIKYPKFDNSKFDYQYSPGKTRKVNMHLKQIRFKTRITPNILDIESPPARIMSSGASYAGWIMSGTDEPFEFNIIGTDQDNEQVSFSAGGIFVSEKLGVGENPAGMNQVVTAYNTVSQHPGNSNLQRIKLNGQKMALAPSSPNKKGDTTFETIHFTLRAFQEQVQGLLFNPFLLEANAVVTSVSEMMDLDGGVNLIPHIEKNGSDLFAYVKSFLNMDFEEGAEKGGGIATPNLSIEGLTKKLGPVGGVVEGVANKIMENIPKFDPAEFFNGVNPKLFGSISLLDLLSLIMDAEDAPKLLQEKLPDKVQIKYVWEPALESANLTGFVFTPNNGSKLKLSSTLTKPVSLANDATFELKGVMEAFEIELFTVIALRFNDISFYSVNGKKPDVSCNFAPAPQKGIEFLGPLKWINALQELIPTDGFYDPPILDIKPSGIDVGFTLGLPDVASGIFALRNMKLSAILSLPLMGGNPLTFTFKFCEKHDPFNLTISFLGGGGFFGMTVNLSGLQRLEVLLEFGASLSINLGVASGGVYVMAGIYFSMETVNDISTTLFQGYIRMGGHLSILGLISISIEFHLSLNYESQNNKEKVWGEAKVKVKVEILFFSKTVTVTARRELKGAAADPTFAMLVNKDNWSSYAKAFA